MPVFLQALLGRFGIWIGVLFTSVLSSIFSRRLAFNLLLVGGMTSAFMALISAFMYAAVQVLDTLNASLPPSVFAGVAMVTPPQLPACIGAVMATHGLKMAYRLAMSRLNSDYAVLKA